MPELLRLEHFGFTYPQQPRPALADVSLTVRQGEFWVLCGASGCGKTTLLRQLKPALRPHGAAEGCILFDGQPLDDLPPHRQAADIGFVLQSPEEQTVTDKVWHELAFGLENLGVSRETIGLRVAEMASFFGIQSWYHRDVSQLSGGQKQLLNLASIMAMQPEILILDEPTGQLDPIAASDFLNTLKKINQELGTTVLITEHRAEDIFPVADRVLVMEKGHLVANNGPRQIGQSLFDRNSPLFPTLPAPMRVFYQCAGTAPMTGPKKGITLVTPTITETSRALGIFKTVQPM